MALLNDVHLNSSMWAMFFLGLGHATFSKTYQAYLYLVYKYAVVIFFFLFLLSEMIDIPYTYADQRYDELITNLAVTLLYIGTLTKFIACSRPIIGTLVHHVRTVEQIILTGTDDTMKVVFEDHRLYNARLSGLILFMGVFTIVLWFINPALHYLDWMYSEHAENATYERILIFGSWFPFDRKAHYWSAYMVQFMGGTYGAAITVAPDAFFWSFMTFAIMELAQLKYKLLNIPFHVRQTMAVNPWMSEKQARRVIANKCFLLHQYIIKFVTNLDQAMNVLMFIDFCVASLQIGVSCMRVLFFNTSRLMLLSAAEYLFGVVLQMMLFYWHANELLLESANLSLAVYGSEWYNFEKDIKMDMQFMMMRSQKPLQLNIGPFFYMSTSVAIGILKTAYSYIALMIQFYG